MTEFPNDIDTCLKTPESQLDSKEYTLNKDNNKYGIKIGKTKDEIILNYLNYEGKFNLDDLIKISKLFCICKSIDEVYEFIINLFNRNKVAIKEINNNKYLKLKFGIYNNIKCMEEKVEIIMYYNKNNKYSIINEIYHKYNIIQQNLDNVQEENKKLKEQIKQILEEITDLKNENINLKKEINSLKISKNENKDPAQSIVDKECNKDIKVKNNEENENNKEIMNNNHFKSNPYNIRFFTELTDDSYSHWGIDNTFTTFTTLNNISYLVYATEEYSIHFYNLNKQKLVKEIQNAHSEDQVTNFRHFVDETKKRDILMSIAADSRNVRLWDIKNWELLTNITNIYKTGYIYSASFLIEDNKNYIVTCNSSQKSETIKVFDFYGVQTKEICNSNEDTYFIDTYFDKKLFKYFILTGNIGYVKSYDYSTNKLYYKYYDKGNNRGHDSIIIDDNKEMVKLIESSGDGFIRIWKFHNGTLLNKICTGKNELRGICLWNSNYLFVGCTDNTIKLVEIENGLVLKSLVGYNNEVCTINKIIHPTFGDCLLTQGWENEQIKLWVTDI
jgi:regulator of replication initiation timing